MKLFLLITACSLLSLTANAQKSVLALDEHNKYIYYQVVEMPGFSADSLEHNASVFFKREYPKLKTSLKDGSVRIASKFLTYATFVKHESGEMNYTLNIECKEKKYRYWISGFTFTPYQRDRYGNFVPQQGISFPLDDAAKFDKKEFDNYLNQTGIFCKQLGDKLKVSMTNAPAQKREKITKKVVTDKW